MNRKHRPAPPAKRRAVAPSKPAPPPPPPALATTFVVLPPGFEEVAADELADLGLEPKAVDGGLEVRTDAAALYTMHVHARICARFLVRLGSFQATSLDMLAAKIRQLPWKQYVWPHQPIEVRVTTERSRLRFAETVENKVSLAINDALRGPRLAGVRPPREAVRVQVRIVSDVATISVDASGELLHRRGWRLATAKAPVRENLAAGILRALDWAPGEALVDPMCGSGTFPIEAATIATGRSPGIARDFAFERWPNFDAKTWNAIVTEAKAMPSLDNTAPIVAGDRDPGAITATRENAQRAGVATRIQVRPGTFMDMRPPAETGLVVMNPPYGQRVAPGQVADIYKSIGRTLRTHWSGWRYGILMPSKPLASALGLAGEDVLQFSNGGIDVWLRAGEVL